MSGVIPQVAALMGPCAAGTAYIPGLADFVPMVKGRGSMALAGPHLVRAAIGEDVTQEELGGSRVHCRKSGVGDLEVADDEECIARDQAYLSFFPSHCEERAAGARRSATRSTACDEALLDVLPESNRKPYDMYEVIRRDRRRRRAARPQARSGRGRSSPASRGWAAGRSGSSPTSPSTSAASSTTTPPTRPRASSSSATRSASRSSSSMDVPGFMVGTKVEAGGDHPPRREDAARGRRRDGAEDHRRPAQGLRRRLLRDVRPRLRARPDRRLADRGDQRDGRRGRGRDRLPQAGRGGRGPGGEEGRADRGLPRADRRLRRRRATT